MDRQPSAPPWTRALRLLTLSRLGVRAELRKQLADAVLNAQVQQIPNNKKINDVDGSLRGWSWVDGTFSWVEPTSYALLALKTSGVLVHPRVQEAERLLLDRVCPDGGWNYGNRLVRGAVLPSMSSPTALAALALQKTSGTDKLLARAMDFLAQDVKTNPSTLALALTVLCFHAFGRDTQYFRHRLTDRQMPDGSWRGQPHLTALAILALSIEERANVFKI